MNSAPSLRAQVGDQMRKMPGSTGVNPYAQLIEDAEGLDKIEQLQDHPNEDLYEKVDAILLIFVSKTLAFFLHWSSWSCTFLCTFFY